MNLQRTMDRGRMIRAIGFDDAPFQRDDAPVNLSGIVCNGTRFEGMVWGQLTRDGFDATDAVCDLLLGGKFLPQVHVVLLDGIAFGGFNVVDLPALSRRLERACVAVMRRHPDLPAVRRAISRLPEPERRLALLDRAGPIHQIGGFVFQVAGAEPETAARSLAMVTDRGQVPEPLRLAHLIGSAIKTGQSSNRA